MSSNWNNSMVARVISIWLKCYLLIGVLIIEGSATAHQQSLKQNDDERVILDFTAEWKCWDAEQAPDGDWRKADFDDSNWPAGGGLLGFDTRDDGKNWPQPGLSTRIESGHLTYLFRTEFVYDGPTERMRLQFDQIIDDAAVYYLNGQEIGRTEGIPDGPCEFGTVATRTVGTPAPEVGAVVIDNPPLLQGRNVLAVSLHNRSPGSSDICLGLRLRIGEIPVPPKALYLTWQRDPTTTMTIQWHGEPDEQGSWLEFTPPESGNKGASNPQRVEPQTAPMAFSRRTVYTAELTGLLPDTAYEFRIYHADGLNRSTRYWFRTMPDRCDQPDRPVRLVFGGDVRHRQEWMENSNRQAARFDPDAIIWGGDLAYANGQEKNLNLWDEFFDACLKTLVTAENRVIPIIVGIGNHEVHGGYYWGNDRGRDGYQNTNEFREEIAPFFYSLFAFPGHPGYGVLDVGNYLSLIILDTDHSGPVEGVQTEWLRARIAERQHVTHLIPVYHVPAYPSVRKFDEEVSGRVREHWTPLFDASQIRVCFEHHDHAFKRSVPILQGREQTGGVIYVGDGAWGVGVRRVHEVDKTWYLARAQSINHILLVTLAGPSLDIKAISSEGHLIDHFIPPPRVPAKIRVQ
jgi:acid phosphatase type 7